jgi:hypothetical protein
MSLFEDYGQLPFFSEQNTFNYVTDDKKYTSHSFTFKKEGGAEKVMIATSIHLSGEEDFVDGQKKSDMPEIVRLNIGGKSLGITLGHQIFEGDKGLRRIKEIMIESKKTFETNVGNLIRSQELNKVTEYIQYNRKLLSFFVDDTFLNKYEGMELEFRQIREEIIGSQIKMSTDILDNLRRDLHLSPVIESYQQILLKEKRAIAKKEKKATAPKIEEPPISEDDSYVELIMFNYDNPTLDALINILFNAIYQGKPAVELPKFREHFFSIELPGKKKVKVSELPKLNFPIHKVVLKSLFQALKEEGILQQTHDSKLIKQHFVGIKSAESLNSSAAKKEFKEAKNPIKDVLKEDIKSYFMKYGGKNKNQ